MKLQSGDIIIRAAEVHDAPLLTKWWNDGEVMAHAGFPERLRRSFCPIPGGGL